MRLYRFGSAEHFDAAVNAAGIALIHLFILLDRREVVYEALNAEAFQRRRRVCHLREKPYVVAVRVREYPRRDLYVFGVRSLLFELIHEKIKDRLLPELAKALYEKNVEIRGDEAVQSCISCVPATEADYGTEYLDLVISMKTVSNVDEAIAHINKYNTRHSEAILTNNKENAEKFLNEVDAACVYLNASTRFTDGFEFGLGAEIGISTQKLHARGPMGLKELTSYKYVLEGDWLSRK